VLGQPVPSTWRLQGGALITLFFGTRIPRYRSGKSTGTQFLTKCRCQCHRIIGTGASNWNQHTAVGITIPTIVVPIQLVEKEEEHQCSIPGNLNRVPVWHRYETIDSTQNGCRHHISHCYMKCGTIHIIACTSVHIPLCKKDRSMHTASAFVEMQHGMSECNVLRVSGHRHRRNMQSDTIHIVRIIACKCTSACMVLCKEGRSMYSATAFTNCNMVP
jgi:hypothetical protein